MVFIGIDLPRDILLQDWSSRWYKTTVTGSRFHEEPLSKDAMIVSILQLMGFPREACTLAPKNRRQKTRQRPVAPRQARPTKGRQRRQGHEVKTQPAKSGKAPTPQSPRQPPSRRLRQRRLPNRFAKAPAKPAARHRPNRHP